MLFLVFGIGGERYALETRYVHEVLPYTRLAAIPQAPGWVAGVLDYRGQPVPVIDLRRLADGKAAECLMSSRILLLDYPAADGPRLLGLLAEQATGILKHDGALMSTGMQLEEAPYLGDVLSDGGALVRGIEPSALLPDAVRAVLFTQAAGALAE